MHPVVSPVIAAVIIFLFQLFYEGERAFDVGESFVNAVTAKINFYFVPFNVSFMIGFLDDTQVFNMLAIKNLEVIENDFFRVCYDVSPKLLLHKDPLLHSPTTKSVGKKNNKNDTVSQECSGACTPRKSTIVDQANRKS